MSAARARCLGLAEDPPGFFEGAGPGVAAAEAAGDLAVARGGRLGRAKSKKERTPSTTATATASNAVDTIASAMAAVTPREAMRCNGDAMQQTRRNSQSADEQGSLTHSRSTHCSVSVPSSARRTPGPATVTYCAVQSAPSNIQFAIKTRC